MIEPEMAYATLEDDMNCAEHYVQHCCRYLLDTCRRACAPPPAWPVHCSAGALTLGLAASSPCYHLGHPPCRSCHPPKPPLLCAR